MWVLLEEREADNIRRDSNLSPDPTQSSGVPLNKWGLVPGQTFIVGRMVGDITNARDSSMSKSHAKLTVRETRGSDRPEVILEDVGSKFGTHLNENILLGSQIHSKSPVGVKSLKEPYQMKEGDRVRFGVAYSIYRLTWLDLHVTSSMLRHREEKRSLENLLKKIDQKWKLESNFTESTTHLVMESIVVTSKMVKCLARGIPVVNSQYFRDLVQCLQTRQKLPDVSSYLPPVSEAEVQLRNNTISFQVNPNRGVLFTGKLFVFLNEAQYTEVSPCCRCAGGEAVLWRREADVETLRSQHIVITPPGTTSQGRSSQKTILALLSPVLSRQSRISVSHTDVYLAIVYCSTQFYCNPERQRNTKILNVTSTEQKESKPKDQDRAILAPETCSLASSEAASVASRVRIPPTQSQQDTDLLELSLSESSQSSDLTQAVISTKSDTNKRTRSRGDSDDLAPPVTRPRLDTGKTPAVVTQTQSMKVSEERGERSQEVERAEKENKRQPAVSDDDKEEDLFGFGSIKPKKRSQPLQDSVRSQPVNKRMKPDPDDIFGFGEIKKEDSVEDSPAIDCFVASESSQTVGEKSKIDENKNLEKSKSVQKSVRKYSADSSGFIGRDEVKEEIKKERISEDVDDISESVVKITLSGLTRPKKAKPSFVSAEDPALLGKPVTNFKKFRKQQLNTCKRTVNLTKYIPSQHDQTGLDDWLRENNKVVQSEREKEEIEQQSESLWNFDTISVGKKNYKRK